MTPYSVALILIAALGYLALATVLSMIAGIYIGRKMV